MARLLIGVCVLFSLFVLPLRVCPLASPLSQRNLGKMLVLGLTFILYMVFGMIAMKVVSMSGRDHTETQAREREKERRHTYHSDT